MDIGTIRTALKDAIARVEGLNVEDLKDNPEVPCAIIYPDPPFQLDLSLGDDPDQKPTFTVLLLVQYVDSEDAQAELDAYLSNEGPTSVASAIEYDDNGKNTLGGVVGSAGVTEIKSYGVIQLHDGGVRYLSAELSVEVYA